MGRHVIAKVSQKALLNNLQQVQRLAPQSKILAMIKANAYGHGLIPVAKALKSVDAFGVACIEEALRLRQAGIKTDIVLIEGIFRPEELELVQAFGLTVVVHHWAQIQALQNYRELPLQPFKVWLKINTGMNRLGFPVAEFDVAWRKIIEMPQVTLLGFMTHFPNADQTEHDLTQQQCVQFSQLIGERPGQKCLANSAGVIAWPQSHADWVRPGLMLYGASPLPKVSAASLNLMPAMQLCSEIIAIQTVNPEECVGYGGTWKNVKNSAKIGIVAIGYGDGYPWHAKNGTPVLVNGQRASTVGRVSMDMLAIDISALPQVKIGDPVMLWGDGLPIEEVAAHAGTIPWELFCRFTERVTVQVIL